MKALVFNSGFWVPWVAARVDGTFTTQGATGFGVMDFKKKEALGGVLFEGILGTTIRVHVAASSKRWMTREFLFSVCDYPFNQLGMTKLIGLVRSDNEEALEFDKKFGFEEEGRIADIEEGGVDLIILTMTREKAQRWLDLEDKINKDRMVA